jgi:hypothetical protein
MSLKGCDYQEKAWNAAQWQSTSFASFSRRRGLFKPSSGISSKATVMEESCWLRNKIDIIITPTHRASLKLLAALDDMYL